MFGSGNVTLIISIQEMNGIIKIIKSLKASSLLTKTVSNIIKNEATEQKGGSLGMLLASLAASLLENLLTGTDTIRAGESIIRAGQDF